MAHVKQRMVASLTTPQEDLLRCYGAHFLTRPWRDGPFVVVGSLHGVRLQTLRWSTGDCRVGAWAAGDALAIDPRGFPDSAGDFIASLEELERLLDLARRHQRVAPQLA